MGIRHDWTRDEIRQIYRLPFPELIFQAQVAHREFHRPEEVQLCSLLSIKTGGCPEDCAYCSQSAHYKTGVARQELMSPADVLHAAQTREGRKAPRDSAWGPPGDKSPTARNSTACWRWCAALQH